MTSNVTSDSVGGHGGIGGKIKGAAQAINGLGENVRGTILGGVDTVLHKDSSANDAIAAKGRAQHADGMENLRGGSTVRPAGSATGTEYGSGYNALQGTQAPAAAEAAYLHEQQADRRYNTGGATTSEATGTGFGPTPATNSGGGYSDTVGTQALDNRGAATAPHAAGGNAYLNNVNQHANHAPHTGAMNAGNEYNPYHDPTAVAQKIPAYDGPGNAQQSLARGDRPAEEPRHHRDDAISGDPDAVNVGHQAHNGGPPPYIGGPPY